MTIGDRIKSRRIQLGMTQEELALKLGYKSKSSINKIEIGVQDLPQKKIVAFAKALETTPAELMGWVDPPKSGLEFIMPPIPDEIMKSFGDELMKKQKLAELSESVNARQQAVQKNEHPMYYTDPVTARIAQRMFEDESFRILFDAAEDSTPENIKLAAEMLRRLKEK